MKENDKQNSDAAQKSELVPQHKRMAMGVPIDGKSGAGSSAKPAPSSSNKK
jgi:hypothetical protein